MKKQRRRGFLASAEGLTKLDERIGKKGYTQQSLAEEAQVSIDQVKKLLHPQWKRKIERDAIRKIANILDLQPRDIVDPSEWYPLQQTSKFEKKLDEVITNGQYKETENSITIEELLPEDRVNGSFGLPSDISGSTVQTIFGEEGDPYRRNFVIGSHIETNQPVCIDLDLFVGTNCGVFGKYRSEQSSLIRLLLAGIIRKQPAVNLIFDLNSEYGWEASKEGIYGKGLKFLFPNEVDIYTLDPESAQRRGVRGVKELHISYDQIEVDDIMALRGELNLSDTNLETVFFLYHEAGKNWIRYLLEGKFDTPLSIPLRRKLMRLEELKYVKNDDQKIIPSRNFYDMPMSGIRDIINSLKRGRHVVVDFGSTPSRLTHKLITNVISRRVHAIYIHQSEHFLRTKNPLECPKMLMITITEAERFLNTATVNQTVFSTIIRDAWKSTVKILAVTRYPSRIDKEIMSEISTRIINLINDEDIDAAFTGVTGTQNLRLMLSKLDSNKKALVFGDAVPRPVLVNVRPYDQAFYSDISSQAWDEMSDEDILVAAEAARKDLGLDQISEDEAQAIAETTEIMLQRKSWFSRFNKIKP